MFQLSDSKLDEVWQPFQSDIVWGENNSCLCWVLQRGI